MRRGKGRGTWLFWVCIRPNDRRPRAVIRCLRGRTGHPDDRKPRLEPEWKLYRNHIWWCRRWGLGEEHLVGLRAILWRYTYGNRHEDYRGLLLICGTGQSDGRVIPLP